MQRYVRNPHLIDGLKYDLRIYVLATSFDPVSRLVCMPLGGWVID